MIILSVIPHNDYKEKLHECAKCMYFIFFFFLFALAVDSLNSNCFVGFSHKHSSNVHYENKINSFTSSINQEIQQLKCLVDDLNARMGTDTKALKAHITEHTRRLNNNEDDINRLKLSVNLKTNGIPFKQSENLVQQFHNIASIYSTTIAQQVPICRY